MVFLASNKSYVLLNFNILNISALQVCGEEAALNQEEAALNQEESKFSVLW